MSELITISHPERLLSRDLLKKEGGFLWWYLDLVNDQGDGAVLIWSWGLPFLPGIASGARKGEPVKPEERPSLTIAIYKSFKLECYTLQEYEPSDTSWKTHQYQSDPNAQTWIFGENQMRVWRVDNNVMVEADIHEKIPGSMHKLVGHIKLKGIARTQGPELARGHDPAHDWTPLMGPASGQLDLYHGAVEYHIQGRGYHDRNGGENPLHELGFKRWIWGRIPGQDREYIYYILWPHDHAKPRCVGMEILDDGTTILHEDLEVRQHDRKRELAGMWWHKSLELFSDGEKWGEITVQSIVDNGPFYLRFFIKAKFHNVSYTGIAEACDPRRVDLPQHRPLVQMRVGKPEQDSIWRPLFTGPRQGRVERLISQFLPGNAP